jgi:hypothetical protein
MRKKRYVLRITNYALGVYHAQKLPQNRIAQFAPSQRLLVHQHRRQLIKQFLGESMLLSFIALLLAVGLAEIILPLFYPYLGKAFVRKAADILPLTFGIVGIGLFAGVISVRVATGVGQLTTDKIHAEKLSHHHPAQIAPPKKLHRDQRARVGVGHDVLRFHFFDHPVRIALRSFS